jgi:hypothetical protein
MVQNDRYPGGKGRSCRGNMVMTRMSALPVPREWVSLQGGKSNVRDTSVVEVVDGWVISHRLNDSASKTQHEAWLVSAICEGVFRPPSFSGVRHAIVSSSEGCILPVVSSR